MTATDQSARHLRAITGLLAVLLLVSVLIALRTGVRSSQWTDLWPSTRSIGTEIVFSLRLPRVVMGGLVGMSLAVAGALMQSLTRNRLAGPSLMGLGPGATLAILGAMILGKPSVPELSAISFVGATLGGLLVFAVAAASPRGATPPRLVLAGAIVGGLLSSVTGALIFRLQLAEVFLYWTLGGLGTTTWTQIVGVLPLMVTGLGLSWLLAPSLTVLAAGEERARALGLSAERVRLLTMLGVLLLAGGAAAAAGPVGFVGVMVPNLCRPWTGPSIRRLLPICALAGALLVVTADLIARTLIGQIIDIPLGVVTAVLGAPSVIWIARSRARRLP